MKIAEFIDKDSTIHGIDLEKIRDYLYRPEYNQDWAKQHLNIKFIDKTEINLTDEEAVYFYKKLSRLALVNE